MSENKYNRGQAYSALMRMTGRKCKLSILLGYPTWYDMSEKFNDEDARTCEALTGPHGYTVFRALLIKRGLKESQVFE